MKKIVNIVFLLVVLVGISGCGSKTNQEVNIPENHERYQLDNEEQIKAFIEENIIINKVEKKEEYSTLCLTISNISDYYINGVTLRLQSHNKQDNDELFMADSYKPVFMRPHTTIDIVVDNIIPDEIDYNNVYFTFFTSITGNIHDSNIPPISLEENNNVIYANDLEFSNLKYNVEENIITVKIANLTNKNIDFSLNNIYFLLTNGNIKFGKESRITTISINANSNDTFSIGCDAYPCTAKNLPICYFSGALIGQ